MLKLILIVALLHKIVLIITITTKTKIMTRHIPITTSITMTIIRAIIMQSEN